MQGFQNLKNNPHHWSIDADKGVPFSAHNCSSLMLKNMLVGQSKRNLDNLSANSTTVIRRAPYWVKYTEQPCPQMHAEKTQDNGRNQSCNFLWPFQCQIHLTEISCFHNSLATYLFVCNRGDTMHYWMQTNYGTLLHHSSMSMTVNTGLIFL